MKLRFDQLEIDQFRAFVKPVILRLDKLPPGLHLMQGVNECSIQKDSNGASKSSIWEALCWCLYGKTSKGLFGTDIRPWSGGKGPTKVTVQLAVQTEANGTSHTITRTANPNSLLLDGVKVGDQGPIDALLGVGFHTFKQTIMQPQNEELFFDLTPAKKMERFAEVLDLDRWEARAKATDKLVTDLINHETALATQRAGVEAALEENNKLIETNSKRSKEWETDRLTRLKDREKTRKEAKEKLERVELIIGKAALAQDSALTEVKAISRELDQIRDYMQLNSEELAALETDHRMAIHEAESLEAELAQLSKGKCPTCGQKLHGKLPRRDTLKKELTAAQNRVEETTVGPLQQTRDQLQTQKLVLHAALDKFEKQAEQALHDHNFQVTAQANLKAEIAMLDTTLAEDREQRNPFSELLRDLKRACTTQLSEYDQLNADLDKIAARIARTKFWVKGFRDVRLHIIEETLQELELVTNAMLVDVGLDDWKIGYATERETQSGTIQRGINITILSPQNKMPVKWEVWSGGEAQRLRVIGTLALSDVLLARAGVEADLEVLDEPTHSLSPEGVEGVIDLLSSRARSLGKRVWFVDQHTISSNRFAGVVTVRKTPAGARLEL